MIHSGAVVAAGVSQGRSTSLGFDLGVRFTFCSTNDCILSNLILFLFDHVFFLRYLTIFSSIVLYRYFIVSNLIKLYR